MDGECSHRYASSAFLIINNYTTIKIVVVVVNDDNIYREDITRVARRYEFCVLHLLSGENANE